MTPIVRKLTQKEQAKPAISATTKMNKSPKKEKNLKKIFQKINLTQKEATIYKRKNHKKNIRQLTTQS